MSGTLADRFASPFRGDVRPPDPNLEPNVEPVVTINIRGLAGNILGTLPLPKNSPCSEIKSSLMRLGLEGLRDRYSFDIVKGTIKISETSNALIESLIDPRKPEDPIELTLLKLAWYTPTDLYEFLEAQKIIIVNFQNEPRDSITVETVIGYLRKPASKLPFFRLRFPNNIMVPPEYHDCGHEVRQDLVISMRSGKSFDAKTIVPERSNHIMTIVRHFIDMHDAALEARERSIPRPSILPILPPDHELTTVYDARQGKEENILQLELCLPGDIHVLFKPSISSYKTQSFPMADFLRIPLGVEIWEGLVDDQTLGKNKLATMTIYPFLCEILEGQCFYNLVSALCEWRGIPPA
jgi:hypothetical protein